MQWRKLRVSGWVVGWVVLYFWLCIFPRTAVGLCCIQCEVLHGVHCFPTFLHTLCVTLHTVCNTQGVHTVWSCARCVIWDAAEWGRLTGVWLGQGAISQATAPHINNTVLPTLLSSCKSRKLHYRCFAPCIFRGGRDVRGGTYDIILGWFIHVTAIDG